MKENVGVPTVPPIYGELVSERMYIYIYNNNNNINKVGTVGTVSQKDSVSLTHKVSPPQ